ncbi:DNA mismatch repair protein Msh3p [Diutina catenulata]
MSSGRRKQLAISDFFKPRVKDESTFKRGLSSRPTQTSSPSKPNPLDSFSAKRSVANHETPSPPPSKRAKPTSSPTKQPAAKPSKAKSKLTPLEQQVLDLSAANPDKMLVIQVGYKYKLFGDDAQEAARILNIMYIPREDKDGRFSYCSFPDVRLHINLKRLLQHGHKLGVVKQMESAIVKSVEKTGASDLMVRELTAVYTQGTYLGDESEEAVGSQGDDGSGYIVALHRHSNGVAIVAVQPMTGEVVYDEVANDSSEVDTRVSYLCPSEAVIVGGGSSEGNVAGSVPWSLHKALTLANPRVALHGAPVVSDASKTLSSALGEDFEPYKDMSESLHQCVVALSNYLAEFRLAGIFTVASNISPFQNTSRFMVLSETVCRALDIFTCDNGPSSSRGPPGSLFGLLNNTKTRFGSRHLRKWLKKPLIDKAAINDRHKALADFQAPQPPQVLSAMKQQLAAMSGIDLEELMIKVHYCASNRSTQRIQPNDVYNLLSTVHQIMEFCTKFDSQINQLPGILESPLLLAIFQQLQEVAKTQIVGELLDKINPVFREARDPEAQITSFFNTETDDFGGAMGRERDEIRRIEEQFESELLRLRKLLKRPNLKWLTNNKEPYLVELRNGREVDSMPEEFIRVNGTKSVSRFRSQKASELYKLLQYHREMLVSRCREAFYEYLGQIDACYPSLAQVVVALAQFDCVGSLAATCSRFAQVCQPALVDSQTVSVVDGVHPVLASMKDTTANPVNLDENKNRVAIITGPNMGGKSSYVKQVALYAILNQIGCWLPAKSASLGVFDRISIRMGASDDILRGNSTFMTEMIECAQIIAQMTSKSLVILDEIGRGTGTTDGIAIASSILQYIAEMSSRPLVLFITHYPSLHTLDVLPGVVNYHMAFEQINGSDGFPEVIFLYQLTKGVVNNSYGLNVAKIAGIPTDVIVDAHRISDELKSQVEDARRRALIDLMAKIT